MENVYFCHHELNLYLTATSIQHSLRQVYIIGVA